MNIITIDCGASFLKGALFHNNRIVKRAQRRSPVAHGSEGLQESVQINHLMPLVKEVILELAEGIGDFVLCISNEMHGFILANPDNSPYFDYISWQKEYGNEQIYGLSSVDVLSQSEYTNDIVRTGMPLRGGLPSSNMLYLKRSGMLPNTPLNFYSLGDYIIRCLSGKEPVCHPTNAAASGLYDMQRGTWNERLIEEVSVPNIRFPRVGVDTVAFELDNRHVTAYPALGDQQAALLGAGVEKEGDLSFNIGTGAQVSQLTKEIAFSKDYQVRPFFNGYYLKSIPHLPSGRALNVYFRFFKDVLRTFSADKKDEEIWTELLKAAEQCTETDLKIDLSFFQTPLTTHQIGSIEHISEHGLTVGTLMSAILQQMVANFMWAATKMVPNQKDVQRIVFSGGVARRIELIRKGVLAHYRSDIPVIVSDNETLIGLYKYATNER